MGVVFEVQLSIRPDYPLLSKNAVVEVQIPASGEGDGSSSMFRSDMATSNEDDHLRARLTHSSQCILEP